MPPIVLLFRAMLCGELDLREAFSFMKELLGVTKVSLSQGIPINSFKKLWGLGLPTVLSIGYATLLLMPRHRDRGPAGLGRRPQAVR